MLDFVLPFPSFFLPLPMLSICLLMDAYFRICNTLATCRCRCICLFIKAFWGGQVSWESQIKTYKIKYKIPRNLCGYTGFFVSIVFATQLPSSLTFNRVLKVMAFNLWSHFSVHETNCKNACNCTQSCSYKIRNTCLYKIFVLSLYCKRRFSVLFPFHSALPCTRSVPSSQWLSGCKSDRCQESRWYQKEVMRDNQARWWRELTHLLGSAHMSVVLSALGSAESAWFPFYYL